MAKRIFVDMDGVVVDFDRYAREIGLPGEQIKSRVGAYVGMKPIEGALAGVKSLIGMGYEVWLATKPPTGVAHAYMDKVKWVLQNLPELKRRIILTHDKGLLGNADDYLIDDRPHKANCEKFAGTLIKFGGPIGWPEVLAMFRDERDFAAVAERDAEIRAPAGLNLFDVERLAQEIRRLDGANSLGAGALAEALAPFIAALRQPAAQEAVLPSEAVYAFAAMLTSLESAYTFGAAHDAAPMANLVSAFCEARGWQPPRDGVYPENIRAQQPSAKDSDLVRCPKCTAPCLATVHERGGDWGWSTSDLERTTYEFARRPIDEAARGWLERQRGELHPATAALVWDFALALGNKLRDAERKYGYSDGWRSKEWMDECRAKLIEHVAKGDPRDVAAYCAFLWYHGERTAMPAQPAGAAAPTLRPVSDEDVAAAMQANVGGAIVADWLPVKGDGVLAVEASEVIRAALESFLARRMGGGE